MGTGFWQLFAQRFARSGVLARPVYVRGTGCSITDEIPSLLRERKSYRRAAATSRPKSMAADWLPRTCAPFAPPTI